MGRRRRWTFERVVVAVQAVAGLTVVALFAGLGWSAGAPGRTLFDRSFPFVVAGIALVVTAWTVARGLWRSRTRSDATGAGPSPPAGRRPPDTAAPSMPTAPPSLSGSGRAELERIVGILAAAGLFAPRIPDPDDLAAAVADQGEPVTAFAVLQSLHEASGYRSAFRIEDHTAGLAFHADQVEQDAGTLRTHVADLDRLAGPQTAVVAREIDVAWDGGPTRVRLEIGGESRTLVYRGAAKYLSTVVHVEVARALRGMPVRLAALAGDAGTWVAALDPGTDLARLDADLGSPPFERWEWLDEQEPHAAGEPVRDHPC